MAAVPFPDASAAAKADAVAFPPLLDTADEIACGCNVDVASKNDLPTEGDSTQHTYGIH